MRKVIVTVISLLQVVAILGMFLGMLLVGGSEYQTTAEAFDNQFYTSAVITIGCIAFVGLAEVVNRRILGRDEYDNL